MQALDNGRYELPVLLRGPATEDLRDIVASSASDRREKFREMTSGLKGIMAVDGDFEPLAAAGRSSEAARFLERRHLGESREILLSAVLQVEDPENVPQEIEQFSVFANPQVGLFAACLNDAPIGGVADIRTLLRLADLHRDKFDGSDVAIAIVDAGVNRAHLASKLGFTPTLDSQNSWVPPNTSTPPGQFRVGHGTMCAHAALLASPRATLVDCAAFARAGGSGAVSLLSHALDGLQALWRSWISSQPGSLRHYRGLVCCNSWGMYHPSEDFPAGHAGRYIDNPSHPFNAFIGMLADIGIDMIFAAGNCGAGCPDPRCQNRVSETIMGANAHAKVLTVAGCDTNGRSLGYSSRGPSIAGMAGNKPDVSVYTHYLGSEALGQGKADSGTSAAAPLAGGIVAALRSRFPAAELPPTELFTRIRANALQPDGGIGWNAGFGFGVLNPTRVLGGADV